MPLNVERLEERSLMTGGLLALPSGVVVDHPFGTGFGGWDGRFVQITDTRGTDDPADDMTFAAARGEDDSPVQPGGRVGVFRQDGTRDRGDFLADGFTDRTRANVVFLAVGGVQLAPTFRPVTIGSGPFTLLVDADEAAGVDSAAVVRHLAGYLAPFADLLSITNIRPDQTPGSYWTGIVGDGPARWLGSGIVGRATLGSVASPNPGFAFKLGYSKATTDPGVMAAILAHEFGHGLGLEHSSDPASIMQASVNVNGRFLPDEIDTGRAALVAGTAQIQTRL